MNEELITALNIDDADGFYDRLMALHRDLGPEQSQVANAKLILLLANHIGERAVLDEALEIVRRSVRMRPEPEQGNDA